MEGLSEALRVGYLVVVALLAAASIWQWRRRKHPGAGWVAAAFAGLAWVSFAGRLPEPGDNVVLLWLEKVPLALAIAFPYFLYRFGATFVSRRRWMDGAVTAFTVALVAWTLLLPDLSFGGDGPRPLWARVYVAVALANWLVLPLIVAVQLWRAGRGQGLVARSRMRTLSVASALLSAAVLGSASGDDRVPALQVAVRLVVLVSTVLFFLGFWPPRWLRGAWRRPVEASLLEGLPTLLVARTTEEVARHVLTRAVDIVGAAGGELRGTDDAVLAERGERLAHGATSEIGLDFTFGSLRVWGSRYAPFFAQDEVDIVRSLGALAELAFARVTFDEQQARIASIVDSSRDAIFGESLDGTILSWNAGAEALYGYRADEAVGQPVTILAHPDNPGEIDEIQQRVRRGESVSRHEAVRRTKYGTDVEVSLTVSPIRNADGAVIGASAIARDISERRQMERELERAHAEAVEASRLKSEFLATMSHEIRTPMNGVIGMTGLLLATDLSSEQREYAETVRRSGEALLTVINDILDFSKIEAGKLEFEVIDFGVGTTVEEVADLLSGPADEKGLELITVVDPDVPPVVGGDPGRLRQVLMNLAGNAVKFTDEGEVVLRAQLAEDDADSVVVRFAVTDTGIGIPAEAQSRMFASFSQADASTTRRYGGTGLGLAISKQLVSLMGGEIGLESEVGKGSTFSFTARFSKRDATEAPATEGDDIDLSGRHVLVVDDNATNRMLVRQLLRRWGSDPVVATDGPEALQLLVAAAEEGNPFDVALLDFHMPGMDGIELATAIRDDPRLRSVRLLLLTSSSQKGQAAAARAAGIDAWLNKPLREWALRRSLATALGLAAASQARPTGHALAEPSRVMRVLVVDDNVVNQKVATRMLEVLGHTVDTAANGEEAVHGVSRLPYDLVLMDVQMPVMDGYEATAAIRALDGPAARTPIVAMTAGAMKGDEEKCLAAGMNAYISKPIRIEDLAQAVQRWAASGDGDAPPPPAEEPPTAPRSALLDTRVLDRMSEAGRRKGRDLLAEFVPLFLETAEEQLQRMNDALTDGDVAEAGRVAHSLKGSSGTLGVVGVARLCEDIEGCAQRDDLDAARALYPRLADVFAGSAAALRGRITAAPPP